MLALPAAVALWILAIPLVSTLYQYGRFTVDDVLQTRTALLGYSVGLLGLIVVKILAPGFYARQVMSTPVKIAFATVLVSQTLALILMHPLGHAGLTLATSIGACFNAATPLLVPEEARHLRARRGLAAVPREARRRAVRARRGAALDRRPGVVLARGVAVGEGRAASPAYAPRARPPISGRCGCSGFRLADFNRRDIAADADAP